MIKMADRRWWSIALGMLLVLSCASGGTRSASAQATRIQIVTFYSATKAAYDAWMATTSTADPPRTDTFPAGTTAVAFYFHYRGAQPQATHFKILVQTQAGATFLTVGPHTLPYANGYEMSGDFAREHKPYPGGSYRASLLIDGKETARTAFVVNSQAGATVSLFYPTSKAAYDAWGTNGNYTPPAPTTIFPRGTTGVAFYARYRNATPHKTTYQIIIRDHLGGAFFTGTIRPFSYDASDVMQDFVRRQAYPSGAYRANVLVDGHVVAQTTFRVR